MSDLRKEIYQAIDNGRCVQDFLWKDYEFKLKDNLSDWADVFQKRVDKIRQIDKSNPKWKVEFRKRLLQNAALSIKALEVIEKLEQ